MREMLSKRRRLLSSSSAGTSLPQPSGAMSPADKEAGGSQIISCNAIGSGSSSCQQQALLNTRCEVRRDSCQKREVNPTKCPGAMLHRKPPAETGGLGHPQDTSGPSAQEEDARDTAGDFLASLETEASYALGHQL